MAIDSHGTGRAGTKELGLCWCTRMLPCSVQSPESPKAASINYVPIPWLFFLISSEKITRLEHNSLIWSKSLWLHLLPCLGQSSILCAQSPAAVRMQHCSAAKRTPLPSDPNSAAAVLQNRRRMQRSLAHRRAVNHLQAAGMSACQGCSVLTNKLMQSTEQP